jgi:hypothetical protein
MVFDVGSVFDFVPSSGLIAKTWQGSSMEESGVFFEEPVFGWATVISHRDNFVVDSGIQPMVVCCGGLVPLTTHLNSDHRTENEPMWWYKLTQKSKDVGEGP